MIGVFDSGIGGLSVLGEIRRVMPLADLLYVADRGRAPYGTRSMEEVRNMSHEVVAWQVDRGVETVVVACNTASAAALDTLRAEFPRIPIIGMEPAVKPAVAKSTSGTIAVFATAATFQGRLFDSLVDRFASDVNVLTVACPDWVEQVEMGVFAELVTREPVEEVMAAGADVLVLGCTHFSFLGPAIRKAAGFSVHVIDPAPAVAAQTERVAGGEKGKGSLTLAASGDRDEFIRLAALVGVVQPDESVLPFHP